MTITKGNTTLIDSTSGVNIGYDLIELTSTKAIAIYAQDTTDWYARVITISGTTITPETETFVHSGSATAAQAHIVRLSDTKAFVYVNNGYTEFADMYILTISGTTITPSTVQPMANNLKRETDLAVLDSSKVLMVWSGFVVGSGFGHYATVISISGTTITENASVLYNLGSTSDPKVAAFSSSKAVAVWMNTSDSNTPYGKILTITGTTVSIGTEKQIDTESARAAGAPSTLPMCVSYISSTTSLFGYTTSSDTDLRLRVLTLNGTTFDIGNVEVYDSHNVNYVNSIHMFTGTAGVVHFNPSTGNPVVLEVLVTGTTVEVGNSLSLATELLRLSDGRKSGKLSSTALIVGSFSSVNATIIEHDGEEPIVIPDPVAGKAYYLYGPPVISSSGDKLYIPVRDAPSSAAGLLTLNTDFATEPTEVNYFYGGAIDDTVNNYRSFHIGKYEQNDDIIWMIMENKVELTEDQGSYWYNKTQANITSASFSALAIGPEPGQALAYDEASDDFFETFDYGETWNAYTGGISNAELQCIARGERLPDNLFMAAYNSSGSSHNTIFWSPNVGVSTHDITSTEMNDMIEIFMSWTIIG